MKLHYLLLSKLLLSKNTLETYTRIFPTSLLIVTLMLFCVSLLCGCDNDFWQDDIAFGTKISDSESEDNSDADSDSPADDDGDKLSNEVESSFNIETRISDTDHDGFDDGLEFVGSNGDPLNGSLSPSPFNRMKLLNQTDAVTSDPDSDLDGLGDTFEREHNLNQQNPDTDGDGYSDGLELVANSDPFRSSDRPTRDTPPASDGIPRTGSGPIDSDGDGMSDSLEALNGTSTISRDFDGDGFSDGLEFLMGSDGTDNLSVPNFNVPLPPDYE